MRGKRSGKIFFNSVKAGFLIFLAMVAFSLSSQASGIQNDGPFSRLPRQVLFEPSDSVQDDIANSPTARAEALLSFNTIPMKTLWLGACMGLIYCLRRTRRA
jgi:hypothetical protein